MPCLPIPKSLFLLAALLLSVGCEASCWPELVEQVGQVHVAFDRANYDKRKSQSERERLSDELRSCPEDTDLFYALPSDHVASGTYSLLDMAIVADDPELTREFFERVRRTTSPDTSVLMYAGAYVALATSFESEKALDELLRLSMSATETASGDWDTPLYNAQVYTEAGLRIIRKLVEAGADVNAANANGHTAIEVAAWNGDLMKVQCLNTLGAPLPAPVDTEKLSGLSALEAIAEVNRYLESADRTLPLVVALVCEIKDVQRIEVPVSDKPEQIMDLIHEVNPTIEK